MSTFSPIFSANSVFDTVKTVSNLSAGKIVLKEVITNTYIDPITATGQFLGLDINGSRKYIKIYKQNPIIVGKYWYSPQTTSWYILSNWFSDINHTIEATNLPRSTTDVIILSSIAPFIDLDSPSWVQPNSINTGTSTVIFSSLNAVNVTCTITGSAVFLGNSTFNI
jgi:hypothetical protein